MANPSLTKLSPEILIAIAKELCTHCSQNAERVNDKEDQTALARLSETCKALRDIAQPILHHRPQPRSSASLFIRTLMDRPDLAQAIKQIELDDNYVPIDLSDEEISLYEELLGKYLQGHQSSPGSIECEWTSDDADGNDTYGKLNGIYMVFMTLATKLEYMSLTMGYAMKFLHSSAGMLPHLTVLKARHYDTEYGFDLADLQGIIRSSPNLKQLDCIMVSSVSAIEETVLHPNVTTVTFINSILENDDFLRLIRAFPALETLRILLGDSTVSFERPVTTAEMAEGLLLRRDTLKELELYTDTAFEVEPLGRHEIMQSLKQMNVLENLTLESDCFYFADDQVTMSSNKNLLVDLLPQSIKMFAISSPPEGLNEPLLRLATVAPEEFPKLKKLMLLNLKDGQQDLLEQAFVDRGIEFVVAKDTEFDISW